MASSRRPQEAQDDPDMRDGIGGSLEEYVDVTIAHKRPSFQGADNGRMAVVIDGATLEYEKWESVRFPYAIFRYENPLRGFWGRGIIRRVAGTQEIINRIVRNINLNLEVVSRGSYLVPEAYDIPVEMMNGAAPFKFSFKGPTPPQWNAPVAVNPQVIQILQFYMQQAFDLSGVSQQGRGASTHSG